jgi:hypothetical protein
MLTHNTAFISSIMSAIESPIVRAHYTTKPQSLKAPNIQAIK